MIQTGGKKEKTVCMHTVENEREILRKRTK
jgi:hypothetical protein